MCDSEVIELAEEALPRGVPAAPRPSAPNPQPVVEEPAGRGVFERVEGEADGAPGWRMTLGTTWVAQLCAMMAFSFVMPFIPFYVRSLGVRDPRVLPIWCGALVTGS